MLTRRFFFCALALAALAVSPAARAMDDDVPSFRKRGDQEKQFVTKVGTAIVKAARIKPQKVGLVSHEYKMNTPKNGRAELLLKMEYYGLVTKKRYTTDIVVKLDTSEKDTWEVLSIEYSDTNPSPVDANRKKIDDLVKQFNK